MKQIQTPNDPVSSNAFLVCCLLDLVCCLSSQQVVSVILQEIEPQTTKPALVKLLQLLLIISESGFAAYLQNDLQPSTVVQIIRNLIGIRLRNYRVAVSMTLTSKCARNGWRLADQFIPSMKYTITQTIRQCIDNSLLDIPRDRIFPVSSITEANLGFAWLGKKTPSCAPPQGREKTFGNFAKCVYVCMQQ